MPASLQIEAATIIRFLLVLTRLGAILIFVPIPGVKSAPQAARIVLILTISIALFPAWPPLPASPVSLGLMLGWLATEAVFGLAVGLAVAFLSEPLILGAQVIGLQAGYSYASTIDPNSEADSPVLVIIAQIAANLFFFTAGIDRFVLHTFARSLEIWPPGMMPSSLAMIDTLVRLGSGMIELGMRLALPIAAFLILVDVTLALLGRMHAQLQLLSMAFPLKTLAALALMAAMAVAFPTIYGVSAERMRSAVAHMLAR
jgi:flagellar biosynthesis protein FliR